MSWEIHVEPVGKNPGLLDKAKAAIQSNAENTGGMVIYLTNGSMKHEVSRVAFVRRASKNPNADFQTQLATEVAKAREAAKTLNEVSSQSDAMV
jgi:hypothetical protein